MPLSSAKGLQAYCIVPQTWQNLTVQLTVISYQLTVVSYQLTVVSCYSPPTPSSPGW
ncbi:MAG TPA: hypothetical protein V6D25_22395 [Leptolyngbyaceae cyanobacterium]